MFDLHFKVKIVFNEGLKFVNDLIGTVYSDFDNIFFNSHDTKYVQLDFEPFDFTQLPNGNLVVSAHDSRIALYRYRSNKLVPIGEKRIHDACYLASDTNGYVYAVSDSNISKLDSDLNFVRQIRQPECRFFDVTIANDKLYACSGTLYIYSLDLNLTNSCKFDFPVFACAVINDVICLSSYIQCMADKDEPKKRIDGDSLLKQGLPISHSLCSSLIDNTAFRFPLYLDDLLCKRSSNSTFFYKMPSFEVSYEYIAGGSICTHNGLFYLYDSTNTFDNLYVFNSMGRSVVNKVLKLPAINSRPLHRINTIDGRPAFCLNNDTICIV